MLKREEITLYTINQDRKRVHELECLKSIKLRRDQSHAHFDKKYFLKPDKVKEDAPLKWRDLDGIIKIITDIYNRYSESYDGVVNDFQPVNIYDVDKVLDVLHGHLEHLKKEFNVRA